MNPADFAKLSKEDRFIYLRTLNPTQAVQFAGVMQKWATQKPVSEVPKEYQYFVTFTMKDPKMFQVAEAFLHTQPNRPSLQVTDFVYSTEHLDKNVHFHALITCSKSIKKEAFKHWINTYGFVDFKRITPGTYEECYSYISKEGPPKVLK